MAGQSNTLRELRERLEVAQLDAESERQTLQSYVECLAAEATALGDIDVLGTRSRSSRQRAESGLRVLMDTCRAITERLTELERASQDRDQASASLLQAFSTALEGGNGTLNHMPDAVDELHARELVENALRDGLPNIIPQQLRDPGKRDDLNTMMQHIVEDDRHDKAPAAEVRRHQHEAESRPSTDQSPARPENLHTSMDHGFADPQQAVAHLMISNMARPAVSAWLGKTSTPSPSDLGRSGSSETSEISEISGIGSEESELMGQIVVAQALGSVRERHGHPSLQPDESNGEALSSSNIKAGERTGTIAHTERKASAVGLPISQGSSQDRRLRICRVFKCRPYSYDPDAGESTVVAGSNNLSRDKQDLCIVVNIEDDRVDYVRLRYYGTDGVGRHGIRKSAHAMVYTDELPRPQEAELTATGEQEMRPPIRLRLRNGFTQVDPMLRIDYEHIGQISQDAEWTPFGRIVQLDCGRFLRDCIEVQAVLHLNKVFGENSEVFSRWSVLHTKASHQSIRT